MLAQAIVSGLVNGSLYALVAVGIVMIFKALDLVNFAHGEIAMVGAYIGLVIYGFHKVPYPIAFFLAVGGTMVLGKMMDLLAYRRLIRQPIINMVMATVAMGMTIKGIVRLIMTSQDQPFRRIFGTKLIEIGGIFLSPEHLLVVTVSVILMILLLMFMKFTKTGMAMRAVAQNKEVASLVGISVTRVYGLTWVIGSALAGAAGILIAPISFVYPDMGIILIKAIAAATIGGLGSFVGAVVGGLSLGVVENIAGVYISSIFLEVVSFLAIIVILIFKPKGIFGKYEIKKV